MLDYRTDLEDDVSISAGAVASASGVISSKAHYLHWGVIQLSVANLVVIGIMIVIFALALLLPFPKGRGKR